MTRDSCRLEVLLSFRFQVFVRAGATVLLSHETTSIRAKDCLSGSAKRRKPFYQCQAGDMVMCGNSADGQKVLDIE